MVIGQSKIDHRNFLSQFRVEIDLTSYSICTFQGEFKQSARCGVIIGASLPEKPQRREIRTSKNLGLLVKFGALTIVSKPRTVSCFIFGSPVDAPYRAA